MLRLVTILAKNSFKTLAVSLSPLMILSPSTIVIFSFEIILFDNSGLTTLQNVLLSQKFFSFKLLKYSLTFSQKCYTQISLLNVSIFIFLSPILEKNVHQICSQHNSFRQILIHKRRMIRSHILLFTRSILIQNLIAGYQKVINILVAAVSQISWENFL